MAAELSQQTGAQGDATADLQKKLQGHKVGDPARYLDVFSPLITEKAALSPDGKHLAYTVRTGNEIYLHLVAVDRVATVKARVLLDVGDVQGATWDFTAQQVDWLCWVTNTRLVFSGIGGKYLLGVIASINADGSDVRVLSAANFEGTAARHRTGASQVRAIGLHPDRADSIIVQTHTKSLDGAGIKSSELDRNLKAAFSVNVLTGEIMKLSEIFLPGKAWALSDRQGRPRIILRSDWHQSSDFEAPILYQSIGQAEGALPLDDVTGLRDFTFAPDRVLGTGSVPLGFDATGDILYFASNAGRDTYGIYSLDLNTKQRLPGALESPSFDLLCPQLDTFTGTQYYNFSGTLQADYFWGTRWWTSPQLVMDRSTDKLAGVRYENLRRTAHWYRPELRGVQEWLAANRPGRSAEILEWDESIDRLVIREQAPADAGAFYVLDREQNTYTRFAQCGSGSNEASIAQATAFAFTQPDGSKVEGLVALPKDSKVKKIPLVLLCPDYPWQRRGTGYQPEVEALTRMGFAVAIYNGRGVWGTGIKERQRLQGDYVRVQAADAVAVADHLASKFDNVSRRAVALYGQGHGGYVALRALQLHPQRFRCAVTVDAWVQGNEFFDAIVQARPLQGSSEKVTRPTPNPLTEQPELIKSPVFTIVEFSKTSRYYANTALHRSVKRNAPESELFVQNDKLAERAQVLARQWARTESFLNYTLYNFNVKLGDTEFLPEKAKAKQP